MDDIGFWCAMFIVVAFGVEIVYNLWNRE